MSLTHHHDNEDLFALSSLGKSEPTYSGSPALARPSLQPALDDTVHRKVIKFNRASARNQGQPLRFPPTPLQAAPAQQGGF